MADRTSLQTAGNSDILPDQGAFGSFAHSLNRAHLLRNYNNSISIQRQKDYHPQYPIIHSALQNGYSASDKQRECHQPYPSNQSTVLQNVYSTSDKRSECQQPYPSNQSTVLQNVYSASDKRSECQQPYPSNQSTVLQNVYSASDKRSECQQPYPFSKSAALSNGHGVSNNYNLGIPDVSRSRPLMYQNQSCYLPDSLYSQNSFRPLYPPKDQVPQNLPFQSVFNPATRFHNQAAQFTHSQLQNRGLLHQENFQQIGIPQGYSQQSQFNLFRIPPLSEHGNNLGRSVQALLPGSSQQQHSSPNIGSSVVRAISEHRHIQSPSQTFVPQNVPQQYSSTNNSSHIRANVSEHRHVQSSSFVQQSLPQQYSSTNSSHVHATASEHNGMLVQRSPQTFLQVDPNQQVISSIAGSDAHLNLCSHGNNKPPGSVHSPLTKMGSIFPFSSPTNTCKSGDHFRGCTETTSINYNESNVYTAHASCRNFIATDSLQQQERKRQSSIIGNATEAIPNTDSTESHRKSSSHINEKSYNLVLAISPKKKGIKGVVTTLSTTVTTCGCTSVQCSNSDSYSLASVNEYNVTWSGGSELMANRHCSTEKHLRSTNESIHKPLWYQFPKIPTSLSFRSDVEAMQADIGSYTTSSETSTVSRVDPTGMYIGGVYTQSQVDDQAGCNQANAVNLTHTDSNSPGGHDAPESGCHDGREVNPGLTLEIKQESVEHFGGPNTEVSFDSASNLLTNDQSPMNASALSGINGCNSSPPAEVTDANKTTIEENANNLQVIRSSSRGICKMLLSDTISVDRGNSDVDIHVSEGNTCILQLPCVTSNQGVTQYIQSTSHSSDTSQVTSPSIGRRLHSCSPVANTPMTTHTQATISDSSCLTISSGAVKDKIRGAELLTTDSSRMTTRLPAKANTFQAWHVNQNRMIQQVLDEKRSTDKHVEEIRLSQQVIDQRSTERHVEVLTQALADESGMTVLPARLKNRRHTSPHMVEKPYPTSKSTCHRFSTLRQSLGSDAVDKSKLQTKTQSTVVQILNDQGKYALNITDTGTTKRCTYSDQKKLISSEEALSAREKVFNMWKAGQVVGNKQNRSKTRKSEAASKVNSSKQPFKNMNLKAVQTKGTTVTKAGSDNKLTKRKQKRVASNKVKNSSGLTKNSTGTISCVVIHGHKLICLKSKTEDSVLLCQFQKTCFPDKTLAHVTKCICQVLKIKRKSLKHPEKDNIRQFLNKLGYCVGSLILTISVIDAQKVYHYMYRVKTCSDDKCLAEIPTDLSFLDFNLEEKVLTCKSNVLVGNIDTTDPMNDVSAPPDNEKIQSGVENPTRQVFDDSLISKHNANISGLSADSPASSDVTLVYGECIANIDDLYEDVSIEESRIIHWLPSTEKMGGLLNTHFGRIRSYWHDGEHFLAVDDLCRILCTTAVYECIQKENINLYSCCQEIKDFLNALDLNLPPLRSQYLVKKTDIGVDEVDDSKLILCSSGQDRMASKRTLCRQDDLNSDITPHKHPRLESSDLLTGSDSLPASLTCSENLVVSLAGTDSLMTQKLKAPLVAGQNECLSSGSHESRSQSNTSVVSELCGTCPKGALEKTVGIELRNKDIQSENFTRKPSNLSGAISSIPSQNTKCFSTTSSDHLLDKSVNKSKSVVLQKSDELLLAAMEPIDMTVPVDIDSCCGNADTIIDHSFIRQHDLTSPESDRSGYSPERLSIVIFDDDNNPDSDPTLNQDSWSGPLPHSPLVVSHEGCKALGNDIPEKCLTRHTNTEQLVHFADGTSVIKANSNANNIDIIGISLMRNTPHEMNASEDCVNKSIHSEPALYSGQNERMNSDNEFTNKLHNINAIKKEHSAQCLNSLTTDVSGRDAISVSKILSPERDVSCTRRPETDVSCTISTQARENHDSLNCEDNAIPLNLSCKNNNISIDNVCGNERSADFRHGEDNCGIVCDMSMENTVSKNNSIRHNMADVTTCKELSPNHQMLQSTQLEHQVLQNTPPEHQVLQNTPPEHQVFQNTPPEHQVLQSALPKNQVLQSMPPELLNIPPEHEVALSTLPEHQVLQSAPLEHQVLQSAQHLWSKLISSECLEPSLVPSALGCVGFHRCVDDLDVVTSSNSNILGMSSYKKAFVKLWQQHRALLGDINRLRQRVAASEAEKERANEKCQYYEGVIHHITSGYQLCDRMPYG